MQTKSAMTRELLKAICRISKAMRDFLLLLSVAVFKTIPYHGNSGLECGRFFVVD